MSANLRNPEKAYQSYNEAAQALDDSKLAEYFNDIGIEGWAVIDENSFKIKEVSTGFSANAADGIYDSTFEIGDVVWHTHPSGSDVHNGDFKSAISRGASRIYASGNYLTYYNSRPSDIGLKYYSQWRKFKGEYTIEKVNVTTGARTSETYIRRGGWRLHNNCRQARLRDCLRREWLMSYPAFFAVSLIAVWL